MEQITLSCRTIIGKNVRIPLLFSKESFSFVGGVNIQTGEVSDYRHETYQHSMTNHAFAFPYGRGSSGAGLVLMEMVRLQTAPAALVNVYTDPVILTGPLICKHFYQHSMPVVNLKEADYALLAGGTEVEFFSDKEEIIVYYQR